MANERKARESADMEAMKRMDEARPVPSQEELDAAKERVMGTEPAEGAAKEPAKPAEDDEETKRRAAEASGAASYKTRASSRD